MYIININLELQTASNIIHLMAYIHSGSRGINRPKMTSASTINAKIKGLYPVVVDLLVPSLLVVVVLVVKVVIVVVVVVVDVAVVLRDVP